MTVTEEYGEIRVALSLHPKDAALNNTKPSGLEVSFDFESGDTPDHWIWLSSDSLAKDEPWFKLTPEEAIDLAYALVQVVKDNTNALS